MQYDQGINMVGVYIITNNITDKEYIGSSVDVERRFIEHKTPKAGGNNQLHTDIQKYGVDNFEFKILEECGKEVLRARELYYIKKLNPYYNYVGKKRTKDEKKYISEKTRDWWNKLPEYRKQEIIKKNLTGPKIGHLVSNTTREKIRNTFYKRKVNWQKVICIETGEVFESVKSFEKHVGACTGTCAAYWKGKIKSVKGYHIEKCRD